MAIVLASVCLLGGAHGQSTQQPVTRTKPAGAPTLRLKSPVLAPTKGTLFSDNFDGLWPTNWYFFNNPRFGRTTYKHYSGTRSLYCCAGGTGAVAAPGPYPSGFTGWITYGPFSLKGVSSGKVQFRLWSDCGTGDEVFAGWSLDDQDYKGFVWTGNSSGWQAKEASMDGYDVTYLGKDSVYFSFYFASDEGVNTNEGAYIDNVAIVTGTAPPGGVTGTIKTASSAALSNVQVTAGTTTAYTDATGKYTLKLAAGAYTVKAQKTGYTFSPTSKSVTVGTALVTANFVGTKVANVSAVAGTVKTSSGAAVKGAVVTVGSIFVYTNSLGKYNVPIAPGTYPVVAKKPGYKFRPAATTATVGSTTVTKNFTASKWVGDGVVKRWAVSVGIANFLSINDLDYCDDDARDVTAALKAGGFPAANIRQLIDSKATKAAIKSAIAWMASKADADDVCVFFQSSHGDRGPDVAPLDETAYDEYLCPYDTNSSRSSEIRDDELGRWLAPLKTTKYVVLIDTCYAGGLIKSAGAGFGSGFARAINGMAAPGEMNTRDLDDLGSGVVVTSCTDVELSEESSELSNGVFAYYLVEGMNNGKADANKNGWYSAEEIFNYSKTPVHAYNPTQTLVLYDGYTGALDFAAAKAVGVSGPSLAITGTAAATKSGGSAIMLSLSAPANVSASILNLAGREVAVLPGRDLSKGLSTLLWSGKSKLGTTVPPGQYLVRLKARGAAGNSASCLLGLRK